MTARIEEAAIRAYAVFIRGAAGSRSFKRDENGQITRDARGNFVEESFDDAVRRRWHNAPPSTRNEFIAYARAMEPVLAQQEAFA